MGYLAVGGIEGFLFVFNLMAKSKVGENKTVHTAEILNIFMNDRLNLMISVSVDS